MVITVLLATHADIEISLISTWFLSTHQFNTERYRSGHNGADSKSVCANAHEGSNPSLSASKNLKRTHGTARGLV